MNQRDSAWVEKRDPQWQGTLADGWPRDLAA